MTEARKIAYKKLMYQAFLDIKNGWPCTEVNCERNFRIAHTFHLLAEYGIVDFEGFPDEEFWNRVDSLAEQFDLHHYRKIFTEALTDYPTGGMDSR